MSLLRRRQWGGVGWGVVCAQLRPRSQFVGPFVRASSLLGPWFPVCRVSLSDCAPCAALNGRICSLLARSGAVNPPPSARPQTGRPRMTNAYGHLLGIHLNLSISEVKPSQAQLVLRWETTWEHWVLYAFLLPLFRHPPRVAPHVPPPISFLPSLPTCCTHGACATACRHAPGGPLPRQPTARAVLSSFQDMGDSVGSARS